MHCIFTHISPHVYSAPSRFSNPKFGNCLYSNVPLISCPILPSDSSSPISTRLIGAGGQVTGYKATQIKLLMWEFINKRRIARKLRLINRQNTSLKQFTICRQILFQAKPAMSAASPSKSVPIPYLKVKKERLWNSHVDRARYYVSRWRSERASL
jgi:hypothetical protein